MEVNETSTDSGRKKSLTRLRKLTKTYHQVRKYTERTSMKYWMGPKMIDKLKMD